MPESKRNTEALVGVFIFVGLALLAVLIVQFGRFGDRFVNKYGLTVVFADAAGVIKGSEVRMGGARIGKVSSTPTLNEQVQVEVELEIVDTIKIPEGSLFQIASATILGDKLVVITPPSEPASGFIAAGSVLTGGGPSGLDAIQDNAVAVSRDARRLLMQAEATIGKIDNAIGDFRSATQELTLTLQKVNRSVLSEDNLGKIDASLANLERASGKLPDTVDGANEAIASFKRATESAEQTFAQATERIEELEPALRDVPEAVASISRAADQATSTLSRVENGEGLIGTLAYDEEVSNDAKTFIKNLKQQGILRYRDKEQPEDDPRTRFSRSRR
ncbi:MlaD family protein [Haloferula chungangensis]|uniref:MlaD family protein n=1 Tax=Haloferula chungangensis TaxID=1048331 RepID=A0ABW2L9L1_9BACT